MHKFIRFFILFTFLTVGMTCCALEKDTPARIFMLDNGHKVIIQEIHANPIVTLDTWVNTGTANETPKINGVSHFLEHLMFKGTPTHKNGEIEALLESKGARCNAATSKDFTHYYMTIASKYIDTATKLHADMLQNPAIPQIEMDKERKVVQEEIRRANDDPKRILMMNLFSMVFKNHPYKMDTLGPAEVIESITREEIFKYYNENYIPSKMTTIVVGDVNTQDVLGLLKQNFNKKPELIAKKPVIPTLKKAVVAEKPEINIIKGNYKSGYAFWGYEGVSISSIKDNYALDMTASILGGSRTSRLYQDLKENKNLVSDIESFHYSLKDDSLFIVSADFDPENFAQVKAGILEEIEKLRTVPVSEEELNRIKTVAKRSYIYANESVENIAESLGSTNTLLGNIDAYKKHIQYIDSITVNDIKRVAEKYLSPNRLNLVALIPEETQVNHVIKDTKVIKDSTKSVLDNGITLITNKNESNDIIALSMMFKGGTFGETIPGIADILSRMLMYGTKKRPYLELSEEIENSGIEISSDNNNDYFEITIKSTKDDFNKAFDILTDIVRNSTFEEKYIAKNKDDLLTEIKKSRDYPVNIASENFLGMVYNNHPYGHIGKVLEQSIPNITREAVVDYWSSAFIPENMVVSASGNIEHEILANKLMTAFPKSGKEPPIFSYKKQYTPLTKNQEIFAAKKSEAAWIFLGWPVESIDDNKEFASLKVIETLMSNGLSSRLHKTFREDEGLAYRVGCSYSAKKDKGHFVFFIGTAPKNIDKVKKKFMAEIDRLKTQPLTKEELDDVKSRFIGSYALSQETNQNKAHLLGAFEVIDKDFGFNYDLPDLINQVTSEDIIKITNKYFNNPYAISITAPQTADVK